MSRTWVSALPRPVWGQLGGECLAAIGGGMTLPFLLVYLERVRGIDVRLAGLSLAALALAGFVGNPLGGALSDRRGARRTLIAGLVICATGAAALAFVRDPWHAVAAAALFGLGAAIVWPAQDALLSALCSQQHLSRAFSLRYATMNAGIAVGGVLGAAIADTASPVTFELLFGAQAALLLAYAAIASRLPNPRSARDTAALSGSYRDVLADPALRSVLPLIAILFAVGYAQHAAAFPAFATGVGGLQVSALGIVFAANAVTIVLAQLAVLRVLGHLRRSHALALAGATWALAWATALAAGGVGGGAEATIGFAAAMALFGLGETMLAPALGPIVNDLATDRLRGRYNGASALSSTTGFMLGPAIAGLALGAGLAIPLVIALGCACLVAAVGALRLDRRLPSHANLALRS